MTIDEIKVFRQIALLGTATLLERIAPKEKLESEYTHFNKTNARNFLLLKLLTERTLGVWP